MFSHYCLLSTLRVRCVVTMTKTCAVAGCNTNHKRREDGKSVIANPATVFKFPGESKEELLRSWTRFCNQNDDFKITNNSGVCEKHFDDGFGLNGVRKTLRWELNPVPTKYSTDVQVPSSVLPTPQSHQKPPTTNR